MLEKSAVMSRSPGCLSRYRSIHIAKLSRRPNAGPRTFSQRSVRLHGNPIPRILLRQFSSSTFKAEYHMSSESLSHLRTLMAWPDETSHPEYMGYVKDGDLSQARKEVASIANAIGQYEQVWLYAKPRNVNEADYAVQKKVTVKPLNVDQLWFRDTGPIFVTATDGSLAGVDTNFNYWGDKNSISDGVDPAVASSVLEDEKIHRIEAPLIFEGGGFESDGEGTLLATESSILNPNRNPGKSRLDIEDGLRLLFGVQKIIWVQGAKGIDVTDSHVDALARFGPGDTVILSRPNDAVPRSDVLYGAYQQAKSVLSRTTNAAGRSLMIVEIEEAKTVPRAVEDEMDPGEACTSYVNFYLANGAAIVPQFGDDKTDPRALEVIKQLWPERDVVPVMLNWMAWAGGGVHCATQQWPLLPK